MNFSAHTHSSQQSQSLISRVRLVKYSCYIQQRETTALYDYSQIHSFV